jgi:hypothetical protein
MNLKFHDEKGNEIRVADPILFARMVREGKVRSDTLLFDEEATLWKRAWEYSEYHAALSDTNLGPGEYAATPAYGASSLGDSADGSILFGSPTAEPGRGREWSFAISALVLLAGIAMVLFATIKYSSSPFAAGRRLGLVAGNAALFAVVSFLVSRFLLKKRRGAGLLLFACCFLGVAVYHTASAIQQARAEQIAGEDISSLFKDMMSGAEVQQKNVDEKSYGQMASVVKILNEYAMEIQSDMTSMNKEIEGLHLETILTKDTLQDAEHINQGQLRLQKMLGILDTYESAFRQRAEDIPNKVNGSSAPAVVKRDFLAGFIVTKEHGLENIREFFNIERSFVAKADDMLNFIRSKQGQYKFTGQQISFNSRRDAGTYNDLLEEILRIAQQEEDWRMKTQSASQEQLEKMQRQLERR